ncbi:uncharacterized protein [Chelonus insularis]|uniref:uncharacterized protein n=1 Tax=Chelonus insularis TaxID=460826 RepID=UPI00158F07EA|nr:uncharacterized protein LOC118073339 [Chelonus insularis]
MKCLLFSGIIVLLVISGETLKCYYSLGIDNPFNGSDSIITCSKGLNMCFQSSTSLSNGSAVDLRTCVTASEVTTPEFNDLIKKLPADVKLMDNYIRIHCSTDYCNGANSILAGLSIVFASLCIFIF